MREKMRENVIITALLLCLVGSVSAESGLVAYYPFDGNANDESGNGNDGTVNGATYVSGVSGQALSFDGVDDYVEVADDDSLDFALSGDFTLEAWVKTDSSSRQFIISKYEKQAAFTPGYYLDLSESTATTGKLHMAIYGPTGTATYATGTVTVNDNVWHHVVMVRDVASDKAYIYVDGALDVSTEDVTTASSADIYPLYIGILAGTDFPFNGLIDEVRIYNRALFASEIQANYDAIVNPTTTTSTSTTTVPTTPSPSVYLYGEKTEVEVGEDISLSFSAVNLITNPEMTVQLILKVPSGMSVTSTGFIDSGAGQYTRSVQIGPGGQKQVSINIKTNQIGNFKVGGEIYYHFENESTPKYKPVELPVVVRAKQQVVPNEEVPSEPATGPPPEENGKNGEKGGVCGPTALLLLAALPLGVYSLLRRRHFEK